MKCKTSSELITSKGFNQHVKQAFAFPLEVLNAFMKRDRIIPMTAELEMPLLLKTYLQAFQIFL